MPRRWPLCCVNWPGTSIWHATPSTRAVPRSRPPSATTTRSTLTWPPPRYWSNDANQRNANHRILGRVVIPHLESPDEKATLVCQFQAVGQVDLLVGPPSAGEESPRLFLTTGRES